MNIDIQHNKRDPEEVKINVQDSELTDMDELYADAWVVSTIMDSMMRHLCKHKRHQDRDRPILLPRIRS